MSIISSSVSSQLLFLSLILSSSVVLSEELELREQAAKQAAQQFVEQLGGHLKKEMKANGSVQAIKVCKDIAPDIANQLSIDNGWSVSRVSSKVRNPASGIPDQWESKVLSEFETLAAEGTPFSKMKKSAIVDENGAFYYRFMKPIPVNPICLTCHGSDETIPHAVKSELDKQYPFDKARGYEAGELRGAISIKQPMDIPLKKKF